MQAPKYGTSKDSLIAPRYCSCVSQPCGARKSASLAATKWPEGVVRDDDAPLIARDGVQAFAHAAVEFVDPRKMGNPLGLDLGLMVRPGEREPMGRTPIEANSRTVDGRTRKRGRLPWRTGCKHERATAARGFNDCAPQAEIPQAART